MKIYRTKRGVVVEDHSVFYLTDANWDELIDSSLLEIGVDQSNSTA